jgi:hypothetical protein
VENRVCLSHDMQVAGVAWWATTRIMAGVGDLMQRTADDRTGRVLSGRTIRRSGNIVCGLYHAHEDKKHAFLG